MLSRLSRARGNEEGFTLIELVVTVAILGIIVSALVGVVFSYLRISNSTSTRLNESTDQQFVSAYWQQDVSSLGNYSFSKSSDPHLSPQSSVWTGSAPSGVPAACAGAPAGTSLVIGFAWTDYPGGTTDSTATWTTSTANAAIYFTKTVGTQLALWRTRCIGGSSTTIPLARYLDPANPPTPKCYDKTNSVTSCGATNPFPATVTLTLVVQDKSQAVHASTGYTTTLTAQRRQG